MKKFDASMDTGGDRSTLHARKWAAVVFKLSITGKAASC